MKIFPGTVKPLSADQRLDLMSHLRYPEDLFKVQRTLLGRYHVTDAARRSTAAATSGRCRTTRRTTTRRRAAAAVLLLAADARPAVAVVLADVDVHSRQRAADPQRPHRLPRRRQQRGRADRATGPELRQLRVLQLPKDTSVSGPGQVQTNFNADAACATSSTSSVAADGWLATEYGNLLTLPLAGGLLYVEPVYLRSVGGSTSFPLLQKVLVVVRQRRRLRRHLGRRARPGVQRTAAGVDQQPGVRGRLGHERDDPNPGAGGTTTTPPSSGSTSPGTTTNGTPDRPAAAAAGPGPSAGGVRRGQAALKRGDFAAYGKAQEQLAAALQRGLGGAEQRRRRLVVPVLVGDAQDATDVAVGRPGGHARRTRFGRRGRRTVRSESPTRGGAAR